MASLAECSTPFKIHFHGTIHANELYSSRGRSIFTLEEAIEEADDQFPGQSYELYNGQVSFDTEALAIADCQGGAA